MRPPEVTRARRPLLTREGPAEDEVQIIGVELAYTTENGQEVELEMFACRHTLPRARAYFENVRVTLHTSQGDVTLRGMLR